MASEQRPRPRTPHPADDEPFPTGAAAPRRKPLGGKLRLPRRRPLREGILKAFARSLGVARRAARASSQDPVAAVHEYRKALRRARAVVSLLVPTLGRRAVRGLAGHLRAGFAVTSAFRDADILLEALARVSSVPEDDLARHAIQVALELEQRRSRAETESTLAKGLASVAALPGALDVVLDPDFSAQDLERGLLRSRRRERKALAAALGSGGSEDFHEWRKRVKELRYQIELLASTGSRELKKREKRLAELAQALGGVTDLTVLAREIERRRDEGTVPPAPALVDRLRALASERTSELMESGKELFEEDPRLFARQVMAERG